MSTQSTSSAETPDVEFTLAAPAEEDAAARPLTPDPVEQMTEINRAVATRLAAAVPEGWRAIRAVFAMTVEVEAAVIAYSDDRDRVARAVPSEDTLQLVRRHRRIAADLPDGPWWRYLLELSHDGELIVDYDFGVEPFPADQLFEPEAYLADLRAHPRPRLPVWLAAYLWHADRQTRPPGRAVRAAGSDRAAGLRADAEPALPPLPTMLARWTVVSAAFVGIGAPMGPRVRPGVAAFEGARRSGATLYELPGGRAVLSGGVWNAASLDAAYNRGEPLPDLYRAAPCWVADPVLNPRAATGLLSFCYWWEDGAWYRAESSPVAELGPALPAIWSEEATADVVAAVLAGSESRDLRPRVIELVLRAQERKVTRSALEPVATDVFDVDTAYYQFDLAGIAAPDPVVDSRCAGENPCAAEHPD